MQSRTSFIACMQKAHAGFKARLSSYEPPPLSSRTDADALETMKLVTPDTMLTTHASSKEIIMVCHDVLQLVHVHVPATVR